MKEFDKLFKFDLGKTDLLGTEAEVIITDNCGRPISALGILQEIMGEHYEYLWPTNGTIMTPDVFGIISSLLHKQGIKQEMFTSQVELLCGPCSSLEQLHHQSLERRRRLLDLSQQFRVIPVYSGMPPGEVGSVEVFPAERYLRMIDKVERMSSILVNGLHVHKGVSSLEEGIHVMNSLRNHLPALIALSANSKVYFGKLSLEYYSKRVFEQLMLFENIIPPWLPNPRSLYRHYQERGWLKETWKCPWGLRINPVGTIEVRIFDGQDSIADELMLVVVTSALIDYARDTYQRKRRIRAPEAEHHYYLFRAALYAATYGLEVRSSREEVLRLLETVQAYVPPAEIIWWKRAKSRVEHGRSGAALQQERWYRAYGSIRNYVKLLYEEQMEEMESGSN